jgi:uncharacterized lipoprotein
MLQANLTLLPMKYIFLILSIFFLSGCALTRDHISLAYEPMSCVKKIPDATNTEVYVSVSDLRQKKDQVGHKSNGFGMQMAPIVCENQLDELIKEALLKELLNRGFIPNSYNSQILIHVELNEMSNKFELGFWSATGISETNLTIKIQNPDGKIQYNKTVKGEGENPNIQLMSGENAKIALERSLQHVIVQIVEDPDFINALFKNPRTEIASDDIKKNVLPEPKIVP